MKCEWCNTAIGEKTSLTGDHKFCTGVPEGIYPYCGETKSVASLAGHRKSCALINERKYNLTEEEANILKEKRKNEWKWDTIACEHCNELKSKANINRHRKACKTKETKVETRNWTANSR